MKLLDFVIVGIILIWLIAVLIYMIRRKKKGGCIGCNSCGCENCKKKGDRL